MALSNKDSDCNPKWKVALLKETSPKTHKPKGPVVVNGKSTPKGKVGIKCPTKRALIVKQKHMKLRKMLTVMVFKTELRYSLW